jgi:ABC-type amino acid transport substrate-binding protein
MKIWLVLSLLIPTFAHANYQRVIESGTIRCGYMLWPYMHERDPNTGDMSGMTVEIMGAVTRVLGLKVEWTSEVQPGQQVEALRAGKIDMMCNADGPWIATSATYLNYTRPFMYVPLYMYGRADETRFANGEGLNSEDVTFSAMDGDTSQQLAQLRYPKAKLLNLPGSADGAMLLLNVVTKKADVVILDGFTAAKVEDTHPGAAKHLWPEPLVVVASSFSTPKADFALWQTINQGLDIIKNTGELDQILSKYDPDNSRMRRSAKGWQ